MIFVGRLHRESARLSSITSSDGLRAIRRTLDIAAIAVPLNTIFGVICALIMVRTDSAARRS